MERAINLPGFATPTSVSGTAYVQTVLNPCGESQPVELAGIPDGGNTDIVVLAMRDDMNWPAPSFGTGSWSTIVFDTPYLVAQQIIVRYNDTDGEPDGATLRGYVNGTADVDMPFYPVWLRPNVLATENILINPNVPTIVFTQSLANFEFTILRPSVLTNFDFTNDAIGWRQLRKFRCMAKGRTMHLNAPATGTQSRINSAHVGTESSPKVLVQTPLAGIGIARVIPARYTVTPPFSFQVLPQQDLNCRQDIFKTGAYDMQRHWNGAISWNELEDVRPIWRANPTDLESSWLLPNTVPNQIGMEINSNAILKYDGFDVNLGWVVTHISGLARGTVDGNNVTVHMKHRSFWEFNVPGDSPWAANKKAPCPMDDGALACEKYLGPHIPHSFEAKYNDWGLLGNAISTLLPGVGKILTGVLGGLGGGSRPPRQNVIADPYGGQNLYGQGGFNRPAPDYYQPYNGNSNGYRPRPAPVASQGKRRRKRR